MTWTPTLGARLQQDSTQFNIWAPELDSLQLVLEKANGSSQEYEMTKLDTGICSLLVEGVKAGDRYQYRVNGQGPFPDPVSYFQPEGVHGHSEIIDLTQFAWSDNDWQAPPLKSMSFYELHVGTFTEQGTYQGVIEKLPYLVDLGITAIELMPVGDFPGNHNWGYDGVAIYAPARCYGRPEELQQLVNEAHRHGLAVFLDVIYNHLGPDGNYTGVYSPYYVSSKRKTPWGDSLNFDDDHSEHVRNFFIENALHWLHQYHFDGLRLDATHAIHDDGEQHFLAELTERVEREGPNREVLLIAEDHRNLANMMKSRSESGWGLHGVWADDFHHQNRRLLHGDDDGYFRDFRGTTADLATTIHQGWFFTGQYSVHLDEPRGTDPMELLPSQFVVCLQNHDQVGNRAMGERLHQQIDLAAWRAASAVFLCCPETPLLFMGQEWAADSPFLFFTDHNEELGPLVTQGRREEFKHFKIFADPEVREQIPDPQATSTFTKSRLNWEELGRESHAGTHRLYQALLQLRHSEPALQSDDRSIFHVQALSENALLLERIGEGTERLTIVCHYRGRGIVDLSESLPKCNWEVILTTEDDAFTTAGQRPTIEWIDSSAKIEFTGPAAVILKGVTPT